MATLPLPIRRAGRMTALRHRTPHLLPSRPANGKISGGWKIFVRFSSDWKKFQNIFQ
jgi:hypothetical protein